MRILIIGTGTAELGQAAAMARASGAELVQVDAIAHALPQVRGGACFDLVLCDIGDDAQVIGQLATAMRAERISLPIVACAVRADATAAAAAIRLGACEYMPLPPDPELIAAILQAAAANGGWIVAQDPASRAMLRQAARVADSEASVMICGESGTGKEVMARYLHDHSRRARGPFVAVNCAAIPEALLESELFGHEKGAFSGAIARRIGRFEAAARGTLLLDEITEMDLRLQAKLLRAIQEREIDRLGGSAPVRIDTRILATTNRDVAAEVAAGRFRADLYFRLDVVSLSLPPLRVRAGDIAPLARHYARHYAQINGVPPRPISPAALHTLQTYPWPGNIRELENVIHRAVLLSETGTIEPEALGLKPSPAPAVATAAGGVAALVGQRMDSVERALILETLQHTFGNRTHAATLLGISIRALRNKLRDYAAEGASVPATIARVPA